MAKYYGRSKKVGKLADSVFSIVKGQTIERSAAVAPANPKTEKQYNVRMRWSNIISSWNSYQLALRGLFEFKSKTESDYNRFVSLNVQTETPVFLDKNESELKAVVIAPYIVSEGSLKSIKIRGTRANSYTDICVGQLIITATTTIAELSTAILQYNGNRFREGDNLCYLSCMQDVDSVTHAPTAIVNRFRLHIDTTDTRKVWDVVASWGFNSVVSGQFNFIGHGDRIGYGGFAWIHTRLVGNTRHCSSQRLIVDNDDILNDYSSNEYFNRAAESYGAKQPDSFYIDGSGGGSISQTLVNPLVSSLRMGSGASPNIALGALKANFATKGNFEMDTNQQPYLALVIKGVNLDTVRSVRVHIQSYTGISYLEYNVNEDAYEGSDSSKLLLCQQLYAVLYDVIQIKKVEISDQYYNYYTLWQESMGIRSGSYFYIPDNEINNSGGNPAGENPYITSALFFDGENLKDLSEVPYVSENQKIRLYGTNLDKLDDEDYLYNLNRVGDTNEDIQLLFDTAEHSEYCDVVISQDSARDLSQARGRYPIYWYVQVYHPTEHDLWFNQESHYGSKNP